MTEISKSDWKLFRQKMPDWQERYMERLDKEYIELLSSDKPASTKFWELYERMKSDKKSKGVIIEYRKNQAVWDIMTLVNDGIISMEDLSDFSDELKEEIEFLAKRFR